MKLSQQEKRADIRESYHEFKELYSNYPVIKHNKIENIITEDSCSGYQFFAAVFGTAHMVSAEGNSNILPAIQKLMKGDTLVIVDGAAFGAMIEDCLAYLNARHDLRVSVWLPESFEYLILKSGVARSPELVEILEEPADYADSLQYESWEQFFTELLEYVKPMGTPVIFLTAKGNVNDRIKGLKLGVDDYIVNPFQVGELTARMEAVLRRYGKANQKLSFAYVEIDVISGAVTKACVPVDLTVKEFDLLVELMQNRNVALYRERIYEKVWGEVFMGDTRPLDSHIQRLRKKLNCEKYIRTVFRVGYRLEDGQ